jgi:hypothetical protein
LPDSQSLPKNSGDFNAGGANCQSGKRKANSGSEFTPESEETGRAREKAEKEQADGKCRLPV